MSFYTSDFENISVSVLLEKKIVTAGMRLGLVIQGHMYVGQHNSLSDFVR
jgi:hypothetical protein